MNMLSEIDVVDGDFSLFLEELTAEPLETSRAAGCSATAFTGGSFSSIGSTGSSVSTATTFSSAG